MRTSPRVGTPVLPNAPSHRGGWRIRLSRTGRTLCAGAIGLVFSISGLGGLAAAQDPDPSGEPAGASDEPEYGDPHDWEPYRGEDPRQPGRIEARNGTYVGRYVRFGFDPENCTVEAFAVHDVVLLEAIALPGACEEAEAVRLSGAVARVSSGSDVLQIHDAPNGLIHFTSRVGAFRFSWPLGFEATPAGRDIDFVAGKLASTLRVLGDAHADIVNATASVARASGRIWIHPTALGVEPRDRIEGNIRQGVVAGEMDVLAWDDGTTTTEILTYEDVRVTPSQPADGHYRFTIDAELEGGRVFVVNVAPGLLEAERVAVRYWDVGRSEALEAEILEASGLADVLNLTNDESATYWVVNDAAGTHVLLAVPHFSLHIFEVFSQPPPIVFVPPPLPPTPAIYGGIIAGVALAAIALLGLVPRRRGRF